MEDDLEVESQNGETSSPDAQNGHAETPTDTSLALGNRFDNPPHLARIRQRLFDVLEPIELSEAEFKQYWPYVDNVWVKHRSTLTNKETTRKDCFMCRLKRPATKKREKKSEETEGSAKRTRRKKAREGATCQMGIKVTRYDGTSPKFVITRMNDPNESHSHDLDHSDKTKRNSVVMGVARNEAINGYHPSSVHAKLREDFQAISDAGGRFLSTTDVRNVSYYWRVANPEVELKFHEGYEFQKGKGVVRVGDEAQTPSGTNLQTPNPPPTARVATQIPPNVLQFPEYAREFLQPYLPKHNTKDREIPHVTLTYASSLDSMLSLAPGTQTALSGPESKAMTHYLRSKHDAILVGVGTVLADDPGLNCRLEGGGGYGGVGLEGQPRPIIVDPMARWKITPDSRLLKTAREWRGRAPWIMVSPSAQVATETLVMLKDHGGNYLRVSEHYPNWRLKWETILKILAKEGIRSLMIEGGGTVMSELLNHEYSGIIDSVIVTIAPTYLGRAGVYVGPDTARDESGRPKVATRLQEVRWQPMGDDVVMCGKLK